MKYTTNITQILLSLSLVLFISACGDKSDSNNGSSEPTEVIALQTCSDVSDDSLTLIESGDTLSPEDVNTSVKITYNEDDTKYVCVLSGTASLLRW